MPRPKILILGLDGMTFDVIRPLIRRGISPRDGPNDGGRHAGRAEIHRHAQ